MNSITHPKCICLPDEQCACHTSPIVKASRRSQTLRETVQKDIDDNAPYVTRASLVIPFIHSAVDQVEALMKTMPGKFKGKTPVKLVCLVAVKAGKQCCVAETDVRLLLGLVGANLLLAQSIMNEHLVVESIPSDRSEFCIFLSTLSERLSAEQEILADGIYNHIDNLPSMVNVPTVTRLRVAAIVLFIRLHGLTNSRLDNKKLYKLFEQVVPGLSDPAHFIRKQLKTHDVYGLAAQMP